MTMDNRSIARKYAFQFLYHKNFDELASLSKEDLDQSIDDFNISYSTPDEEDPENKFTPDIANFGKKLIVETLENHATLASKVSPFCERNNFEKLDTTERNILLLAALEMTHHPDTPNPVIINEYVNLSKSFGGEKTPKFVNAVLDKLAKNS